MIYLSPWDSDKIIQCPQAHKFSLFSVFAGINILLHIFSNASTLISVRYLPEVAMLTQRLSAFLIFIDTSG